MNPDIVSPARRHRDGFATVVDLASRFDRPSPVSSNHCWRCGAADVELVNDPYISRRKRCHPDLPCVGRPVDAGRQQAAGNTRAPQNPEPNCPRWCVEVHGNAAEGGWRHRSATFETTLDQARPERFDAYLVSREHATGEHEPAAVCVVGESVEFRMTAVQARQLSNALSALANLSESTDHSETTDRAGRDSGRRTGPAVYPPNLSQRMATPAA